jgi:hypothetical protein
MLNTGRTDVNSNDSGRWVANSVLGRLRSAAASVAEGELPDTNRGVLLEAITDDRIIYLPVQPPSGANMAALN